MAHVAIKPCRVWCHRRVCLFLWEVEIFSYLCGVCTSCPLKECPPRFGGPWWVTRIIKILHGKGTMWSHYVMIPLWTWRLFVLCVCMFMGWVKNMFIFGRSTTLCVFIVGRGWHIFILRRSLHLYPREECRPRLYVPWCVTTIIRFLNYRKGVLGSHSVIITCGLSLVSFDVVCVLSWEELKYFQSSE